MTDRPILFSAPMVRAILAGQKCFTRRLATSPVAKCVAGDRLWVREPVWTEDEKKLVKYEATESIPVADPGWKERNSMHMPRWASRLVLFVHCTFIGPLHAITDEGAREEGVADRDAFAALWNELHGPGAWEGNPVVVAIHFKPVNANIDLLPGEVA